MPRQPRVYLPGVPMHIVQRGHNRQPCFFNDGDRERYLHWLGEALAATQIALHAYVLMTNHVHLLLTPLCANAIPALMMSLGRQYVQSINKRYGRTGTLWDRRYRASLVASERYYLTCQRYIELNPVRAGMVNDPLQYRWSSCRFHLLGHRNSLVSPHPAYLELGPNALARQEAYAGLFESTLDARVLAQVRRTLNQGRPFGDAGFMAKVSELVEGKRVARPRGRPWKHPQTATAENL